jgi:hypothetical protein
MARILGLLAWDLGNPSGHHRTQIFQDLTAKYHCPDVVNDPAHFVAYTHRRFEETGSIVDRPRSGRPPLVAPDVAVICGEGLCKGYELDGIRMSYHSVQDACERNEVIRQLVKSAGVTPDQMWEAVQKANPDIIKKKQEVKFELSPEVKDQRYTLAQQLDNITDYRLLSTIWIDEMEFWAIPEESVRVICHRGYPLLPLHDTRLNRTHVGVRKAIKVSALYAVNAEVGLVGWWPLSGTTDWTPNYQVQ